MEWHCFSRWFYSNKAINLMEEILFSERPEWVCNEDWQSSHVAAHHIDEEHHCMRLLAVKAFIEFSHKFLNVRSIVDIGCGDGGLLESVKRLNLPDLKLRGYDYSRTCYDYAINTRKLDGIVSHMNFERKIDEIDNADCYVCSEVLEHLETPRDFLKSLRISKKFNIFIASSPTTDTRENHYIHHAWAWDNEGYIKMFMELGFEFLKGILVDGFQVVLCKNKEE